MTQKEMVDMMEYVFDRLRSLRAAGQQEYAIDLDNAFRNFDALGAELGLDRKMVLWVYAKKHIDGIVSYLRGHKSQRENIRGRISDLMVYLCLLWGMIEAEERYNVTVTNCTFTDTAR